MAKKKNTDDLSEEVVKEEGATRKSGVKAKTMGSAPSTASMGGGQRKAASQTSVADVTDAKVAQNTALDTAPVEIPVKEKAVQQVENAADTADLYQDAAVETPNAAIQADAIVTAPNDHDLAVTQSKELEYRTEENIADADVGQTSASTEQALAALTALDAAQIGQSVKSKSEAEQLLSDYHYTESDAVSAANQALADYVANAPEEYTSSYQEQIDGLLEQIINREDFAYDFDADPLYQQYKNQYAHNAQLAMQDTLAEARAATGGYGSSYATQAASGAYQDEINQLTNEMPALYELAYSLYRDKGEGMRDNLSALTDQEAAAQALYQDLVDNYYTGLSASTKAAENAYAKDYGQYEDSRDYLQELLDYYAGQEQQVVENNQAQREYELAVQKYEESVRQWEAEQNQFWTKYYASQAANNGTTNTSITNNSTSTSGSGASAGKGDAATDAFTLSAVAQDLKNTITHEMRNYAKMTGEQISSSEIAEQVQSILKSYYRNDIITKQEANSIGAAYGVVF